MIFKGYFPGITIFFLFVLTPLTGKAHQVVTSIIFIKKRFILENATTVTTQTNYAHILPNYWLCCQITDHILNFLPRADPQQNMKAPHRTEMQLFLLCRTPCSHKWQRSKPSNSTIHYGKKKDQKNHLPLCGLNVFLLPIVFTQICSVKYQLGAFFCLVCYRD